MKTQNLLLRRCYNLNILVNIEKVLNLPMSAAVSFISQTKLDETCNRKGHCSPRPSHKHKIKGCSRSL